MAPSLYKHCWLSSVVSERLIAARPSKLRRWGTPEAAFVCYYWLLAPAPHIDIVRFWVDLN